MDIKWNYDEGIKNMKDKCKNGNKGVFCPEPNIYPELEIHYPGYKKQGDYRLVISTLSSPPSHIDICDCLYDKVKNKNCNYEELKRLLEDIYLNGTTINTINYKIYNVEKIIALIYWITLQDEINYQQPRFQGRKMPFCRYFEAIYCAKYSNADFTIEDVHDRCNNRGYIPSLYQINFSPCFYN